MCNSVIFDLEELIIWMGGKDIPLTQNINFNKVLNYEDLESMEMSLNLDFTTYYLHGMALANHLPCLMRLSVLIE